MKDKEFDVNREGFDFGIIPDPNDPSTWEGRQVDFARHALP